MNNSKEKNKGRKPPAELAHPEKTKAGQKELRRQIVERNLERLWEKKNEKPEEKIELMLKWFPESLQQEVERYKIKLKDALRKANPKLTQGEVDEHSKPLIEEKVKDLEKIFIDSRPFLPPGTPNRAYAEVELKRYFDELIPREKKPEPGILECLYRVDGDIDDFKLINDYYGHQIGNEILKTYVEILRDGQAKKWLLETGLIEPILDNKSEIVGYKLEGTLEGGEESGFLINFKKEFKPISAPGGKKLDSRREVMQEFIRRLQEETLTQFAEIFKTKDENGAPIYKKLKRENLPARVKDLVTEKFIPAIGVSLGFGSAAEALSEEVEITDQDTYDTALIKARGKIFKLSDERSSSNKEARKKARQNAPEGSNEWLTRQISPRGRAEVLEDLVAKLEAELAEKLKSEINK